MRSRAAGSLFSLMKAPASAALPAPVSGLPLPKKALTLSGLASARKRAISARSRSSSWPGHSGWRGGIPRSPRRRHRNRRSVFEPGGKLARGTVLDARDRGMCAGVVASIARAERSLEIGGIRRAELIVEEWLQDVGVGGIGNRLRRYRRRERDRRQERGVRHVDQRSSRGFRLGLRFAVGKRNAGPLRRRLGGDGGGHLMRERLLGDGASHVRRCRRHEYQDLQEQERR